MIQAIHRGYSIQKLSKDLSERMKVSYHNAERLVRTELNYIENRAAFDAMKDADLEFYQFVATLDNRTTPMCQSLDGRVFPLEEKNQGENAPPMHVRCRSTIIGSLDDGKSGRFVRGSRAAKDENGKRIKIPADMNYNDWKKVYIDKTQTLADWRKAKDAEDKILREKDKNSKIRVEGREIIKKLANGENVTPRDSMSKGGKNSVMNNSFRLPDGDYNLTVRRQVQNRHITGTAEHQRYVEKLAEKNLKPSILAENVVADELIRKFHKKGIYDPNPKDGSPREIVDTGEIIGKYWDNDLNELIETTFIKIVYSKNGTHIYPIKPLE